MMKPRTLAQREYRFDRIPQDELKPAWLWEVEREAHNVGKPWLSLTKDQRRIISNHVGFAVEPLRELPDDYAGQESFWDHASAFEGTPIKRHILELNWSTGKRGLLRAFEEWIDAQPWNASDWPAWQSKGGRPTDPGAGLLDLAMLRLRKRYTVAESSKHMEPLRQWSMILDSTQDGRLSPQHWPKAIARAQRKIDEHRNGPSMFAAILHRVA